MTHLLEHAAECVAVIRIHDVHQLVREGQQLARKRPRGRKCHQRQLCWRPARRQRGDQADEHRLRRLAHGGCDQHVVQRRPVRVERLPVVQKAERH